MVAFIAAGSRASISETPTANAETALVSSVKEPENTSVDDIVATTLAAGVAETANLPISRNVATLSLSLAIEKEIEASASTGGEGVTKSSIVQPASDRRDLMVHVVKEGENVDSLANEYGVSKDTIKWANKLTSDSLEVGKELIILPVDGVVYDVKEGDTVAKLAERYKSREERIIAFNDLELSGLEPGTKIVIPSGELPETERPGYVAPTTTAASSPSSSSQGYYIAGSVGNRYAWGWCTWYAYERRPEIGSFWGNASNWSYSARAAGFTVVAGVPKAGAIFQYGSGGYGGGYGHVGIVESVDEASGTMVISDMNGIKGFGRVGTDTVPINRSWNYIY